jgi:hypothetical protein
MVHRSASNRGDGLGIKDVSASTDAVMALQSVMRFAKARGDQPSRGDE